MDPFGIADIASHVDAICAANATINTVVDIPKAFEEVARQLILAKEKLKAAQPKLEGATMLHYQSVSTFVKHCSDNVKRLGTIFQALESKCNNDQSAKRWAAFRPAYLEVLQYDKQARVENLTKDTLNKVKELCLHEVVLLPVQEIDAALDSLDEAGPSLDDVEFSRTPSVMAQQTVNEGGFGQQNNPTGGCNTFNSGYNISGGTVSFGHMPVEGQKKEKPNDA